MIKLNDRIWYFDIDAKNNLQTGIVNYFLHMRAYKYYDLLFLDFLKMV